ncbi:MAG: hypothetical protein D6815_07655 [Candidatus Dadabacteria bacterium]|nr:MAG: hypothetical protein D6815_07655 [Candidatus Dadabacteria bacterium]
MSRAKAIVQRSVAATSGLVLALACVELVPRLVPGLMPAKVRAVQRIYNARATWEQMMRGHEQLGFVLRPDLDLEFPSEAGPIRIRTKPLPVEGIGYRDIGTAPPFDGIALGDSFTFCDDARAEDCWVRHLSNATGLSLATLGVNGYSNLAEARLLDLVGPAMKPRLVLVGFFPNDFKDNLHFELWRQSGTRDDYWTWMRRRRRSDLSDALARHSILYRLVDAARRYGKRDTREFRSQALDFVFRADAWWREVVRHPGQTPGFRLTRQAFAELKRTSEQLGAELVILLFPFKEQVYWDIAKRYQPPGERFEQAQVDAPLNALLSACEEIGVRCCNLLPGLRRRAKGGVQLYHRVSAHWNAAGNQAAAEEVAACLERWHVVERVKTIEESAS